MPLMLCCGTITAPAVAGRTSRALRAAAMARRMSRRYGARPYLARNTTRRPERVMDLTFTDEQLAFRDELRDWLQSNPPGDRPTSGGEDAEYAWARDWQRRLNDGGWAGVHWPTEFGGRGASLTETAIFFEELGKAGAPLPANVLGLLLAGPTIMIWGSDEQKERYLPPILS